MGKDMNVDHFVNEENREKLNMNNMELVHVDLDLNKNVENANGLVKLHMSGYFFTIGDIDQIESYFSK